MYRNLRIGLTAVLITAAPVLGQLNETEGIEAAGADGSATAVVFPADRILQSIANTELRAVISETLERNPGVARARAQARAADLRAPQVRALPDPVAGVTAWLSGPETRTGPQVLTLSWIQALPWLSKLDLKEQAALFEASALHSEVEASRLG